MTEEQKGERIAKWLARVGVASRRDVERMIEAGRIRLNNAPVTHPATFVQAGDIVQVDGKVVGEPERTRVWRYHKPDGLMTTHRDPQNRPTVFESLPEGMPRVVSVGRLDINSEGLLLLTNDGALARRLELPSNAWVRRYRVRVFGVVDEKDSRRWRMAPNSKACVMGRSKPGWIRKKATMPGLPSACTKARTARFVAS